MAAGRMRGWTYQGNGQRSPAAAQDRTGGRLVQRLQLSRGALVSEHRRLQLLLDRVPLLL